MVNSIHLRLNLQYELSLQKVKCSEYLCIWILRMVNFFSLSSFYFLQFNVVRVRCT